MLDVIFHRFSKGLPAAFLRKTHNESSNFTLVESMKINRADVFMLLDENEEQSQKIKNFEAWYLQTRKIQFLTSSYGITMFA